jgi:hypothetical protein
MRGNFSDESKIYGGKGFEPRHPTPKKYLLALAALRLAGCNLSGNQRRETSTPVWFLDYNCTRNRPWPVLSVAGL